MGTVQYRTDSNPPSRDRGLVYNSNHSLYKLMTIELLSPEIDHDLQKEMENDDQVLKNVEQEIECPRCYDIMTLSSDFDRLLYICQECDLSLVMK